MTRSANQNCPRPTSRGNAEGKELHVAPMVDVSTREFRAFLRILTTRTTLWTPMVVDETIVQTYERGGLDLLEQEQLGKECTNPVICQIGGNSPAYARKAAALIQRFGYDEVNLNLGCPSYKVAGGRNQFGCALMRQPDVSRDMIKAMLEGVEQQQHLDDDCTTNAVKSTPIPISAKTRIGIDSQDSLEFIMGYMRELYDAGCRRFVLHARKVLTHGISPAENRQVPPLNYFRVYRLCEEFPDCKFWINGGLASLADAQNVCYGSNKDANVELGSDTDSNIVGEGSSYSHPDHRSVPCRACRLPNGSCVFPPQGRAPSNLIGAMLGRAAINDVAVFADADRSFYGELTNPCRTRREALERYCEFLETAYPRRCCDDIHEMTHCIYLPRVKFVRQCCNVCVDIYGRDHQPTCTNIEKHQDEKAPFVERQVNESSRIIRRLNRKCPDAKITTGAMIRALKPTLGLFARMTGSKWYRRRCEDLSKDAVVRNCGPAYIIRKVMAEFPGRGNALDQPFVEAA